MFVWVCVCVLLVRPETRIDLMEILYVIALLASQALCHEVNFPNGNHRTNESLGNKTSAKLTLQSP